MPVDVEAKVKAIIAEQLQVDEGQVTPEANLVDDLGADSIDAIELVMQFEVAFDIDILDEAVEKWKTVRDVLDYIAEKTK